MCKKVLYFERREKLVRDYVTDFVEVELREWSDLLAGEGRADYVLETRTRTKGETDSDLKVFKNTYDDNQDALLIREAIDTFDELLASHPVLADPDLE